MKLIFFNFWFLFIILSVRQGSNFENNGDRKEDRDIERGRRQRTHIVVDLSILLEFYLFREIKFENQSSKDYFILFVVFTGLFQLYHQINYPYSHRSRIQNHLLYKGPVESKQVECDFQFADSSISGDLFFWSFPQDFSVQACLQT